MLKSRDRKTQSIRLSIQRDFTVPERRYCKNFLLNNKWRRWTFPFQLF